MISKEGHSFCSGSKVHVFPGKKYTAFLRGYLPSAEAQWFFQCFFSASFTTYPMVEFFPIFPLSLRYALIHDLIFHDKDACSLHHWLESSDNNLSAQAKRLNCVLCTFGQGVDENVPNVGASTFLPATYMVSSWRDILVGEADDCRLLVVSSYIMVFLRALLLYRPSSFVEQCNFRSKSVCLLVWNCAVCSLTRFRSSWNRASLQPLGISLWSRTKKTYWWRPSVEMPLIFPVVHTVTTESCGPNHVIIRSSRPVWDFVG